MEKMTAGLIVAVMIFALAACGIFGWVIVSGQQNPADKPIISASGSYTMTVNPDLATLYVGYTNTFKTAQEAQDAAAKVMNQAITDIKALGVTAENIKTSDYRIDKAYDWQNNMNVFKGYTVVDTIEVKVEALDTVGKVLEAANNAGANQVYGISFGLKDATQTAYNKQLFELASKDARVKADAIALGIGATIKGVKSVNANDMSYYPMYAMDSVSSGAGASTSSVTPTVQPGTLTLTKQVTAEFYI